MATEIEVEMIQKETVKPSSPTPDNRRSLNLSFIDQLSPVHRTPILLFYPAGTTDPISIPGRSQILKQSLSQTLTRFFPFAGRLRDNVSIECNDEGAEFVVARVSCPLEKILENPDPATLSKLIPSEALPKEALFTSPLLLVKVNFFDCGGMAIGVCLSHKAGDASTLSTFLNSWAATTSKPELLESVLIPQFVSSSIFPPQDSLASLLESYQEPVFKEKIRVKRLVFPGASIDALRSKAAANSTVRNTTRVEAVSALIWKCAIEASTASNKSDQLTSAFIQAVNIRRRLEPSLPENFAGNLAWPYQAKKIMITSGSEASEVVLKDLVVVLRKGIEKLEASCRKGIRAEDFAEEMSNLRKEAGFDRYSASSWCRFPMYDVNFGWGKPVWVCVPNVHVKNIVLMMDTRDGHGIEVLVSLVEEEMERFERNQELLKFASFDTNVVNY